MTARWFGAVLSSRVATRRRCLSVGTQSAHAPWRWQSCAFPGRNSGMLLTPAEASSGIVSFCFMRPPAQLHPRLGYLDRRPYLEAGDYRTRSRSFRERSPLTSLDRLRRQAQLRPHAATLPSPHGASDAAARHPQRVAAPLLPAARPPQDSQPSGPYARATSPSPPGFFQCRYRSNHVPENGARTCTRL